MRTKKPSLEEIANAPSINAIDALRRNLLYSMISGISGEDMAQIVAMQVDKAKEGDSKAAKLIMDTIDSAKSRESYVEAGAIVDYKVEIRKLIACLIAFDGPKTTEEVASRLHLPGTIAIDSLMCQWFTREGGKWHITNAARTQFIEVKAIGSIGEVS